MNLSLYQEIQSDMGRDDTDFQDLFRERAL